MGFISGVVDLGLDLAKFGMLQALREQAALCRGCPSIAALELELWKPRQHRELLGAWENISLDMLAYPGIDQECSGMAHGHSSRNDSSGPPYRLCAWDPSIPLLGRIPQDTRSVWETRSVWDIAEIQSKSRECMGCPRASQGVSKIIKSFTDIR